MNGEMAGPGQDPRGRLAKDFGSHGTVCLLAGANRNPNFVGADDG